MSNKCPYCGGKRFYPAEDEGGCLRFMCCEKCHATGPTFYIPQGGLEDDLADKALNRKELRAFCHPAHLLKNKVLIRPGWVAALVSEFCSDCLFANERPLNCGKCKLMSVRRILAAAKAVVP